MNKDKQYVVVELNKLKGLHIAIGELYKKLSDIFGVEKVRFDEYELDDPFEKLIFTIDIKDNPEIDACGRFVLKTLLLKDVEEKEIVPIENELLLIEDVECDFSGMKTVYLTLDKAKSLWQTGNEILTKIALKGFSREELELSPIRRPIQLTQKEYHLFTNCCTFAYEIKTLNNYEQ